MIICLKYFVIYWKFTIRIYDTFCELNRLHSANWADDDYIVIDLIKKCMNLF